MEYLAREIRESGSGAWSLAAHAEMSVGLAGPSVGRSSCVFVLTTDIHACELCFCMTRFSTIAGIFVPCLWVWSFQFRFHAEGLVSLVPVLPEVSYFIYFKSGVTKDRKQKIINLRGMGSSHTPLRALSLGFLHEENLMQPLCWNVPLNFSFFPSPVPHVLWAGTAIRFWSKWLMTFQTSDLLFGFFEDVI